MNGKAVSHRPLTERYRPYCWGNYYQGTSGEPITTLAHLDERMDFSQSLIFSGPMGTGKTSAARQRGARRGCGLYGLLMKACTVLRRAFRD